MTARPDEEQERVLASAAEHIVVVAPPGTGKTSLAARLAAKHAAGLQDHQRVLLLTFSNQARSELEREAARHVDAAVRPRVHVTNYHRFFWALTHEYRRALGLPEEVRVTSGNRRGAVVRGAARRPQALRAALGVPLDECAELLVPGLHPVPALEREELGRVLDAVRREHSEGNLVFGDFGALWARVVRELPTVARALRERYPVVIADEHQDASAVQEALVRELAQTCVVFADPMQLIHAFRGADWARLQRHLDEADEVHVLRTPHRWHDSPELGAWLLDVRARLEHEPRAGPRPMEVVVTLTDPRRGMNGQLAALPSAVLRARDAGAQTVAVMAWRNDIVADARRYLCRHGMEPAQLGIWHAFDRLVELPGVLTAAEPGHVPGMILNGLADLVPVLDPDDVERARRRLAATAVRSNGAGPTVAALLAAAGFGYRGAAGYLPGVVAGVDALARLGLHAPAAEEVRLLRDAAVGDDLGTQVRLFEAALIAASQRPSRTDRGVLTMSVHQSKGREFDAIVLLDATGHSYRWAEAESIRLFYVAITRARRHWEVIAPRDGASPLIDALGT